MTWALALEAWCGSGNTFRRGAEKGSFDARHQGYAVDAGFAGFVEDSGYVLEFQAGGAGYVDDAVGAAGQDLFQAIGQAGPGYRFGVDVEGAVLMNADYDFAWRGRRLIAIDGRLRDAGVQAVRFLGQDYHHDD